jgi:hypothetical protein
VGDQVHEPRHAACEAVHETDGRSREDARRAAARRDVETVAHVGRRLARRERPHVPAQRDPLVQLHQLGVQQQRAELRLPHEHHAEQLLRRRLEVREQPELLEHVDRERLRLVDDDDRAPARLAPGQQVRVEGVDQHLGALAARRQAELAVDRLEKLDCRQGGVEDVRRRHLGPEAREEGAQQRRLPGADVARDADEAGGLLEAELEMREPLGVLAR